MARPKTVKAGQKVNLYLPKTIKQRLFSMASGKRKSMSAVVTDLIMAEAEAINGK